MLAAAAADPAREVCGLLLGRDVVTCARPARNVAADPVRRFEIDASALFEAIRNERHGGPRLIGYYHSHPNGSATPSERDRVQAIGDPRFWLIVADGCVSAWRMASGEVFEAVTLDVIG